jgi:23S rRNA (uracil1939-C5)-methyltransferase
MAYEAQLEHKRLAVDDAMQKSGVSLEVSAAHYLENPWRYRSTASISLGRSAGFRRHGSLAIVPIHDCEISHPLIGRLMHALNQLLAAGDLPDFRGRVRIDVRVAGRSEHDARLSVLIRPDRERRAAAQELELLIGALESLSIVDSITLVKIGGSIDVIAGEALAPTMIGGRAVWLAAASFFQTNPGLLPELIARLREEARPRPGLHIADVYGGVGIFGLFLATDGARVTVIENDPVAVEAGRRTAAEWEQENVRFLQSSAGEGLAAGEPYDAVVVDPPRAGLDLQALNALAGSRPHLVLYVSCLAESLARDVQILSESGYSAEKLELFDFYPQTYHVELLAVLRLSTGSGD